ncbi:MAG: T9SS type A sorting domain-containing protein [Bacteroidetes bacterium]|nr:T9SS type A sorting domain-containing protein [Bacteroidota bacterium]MBP6428566.1 T9SS type A sorting domain-containing protein [Bacteroidia bacterium]
MRNYPNPFSTNTIIEINSYLEFSSSNLVVTNVLGERIKSYEINAVNTKFEICYPALEPGIYYYFKINKDGKIVLTKSMVVTN